MIRDRQKKLHILLWVLGVFSLCLAIAACIGTSGVAKLPESAANAFDDAWVVEDAQYGDTIVHAPETVSAAAGETVVLTNMLPDVISENTVLMLQTCFQHFTVEIAGNLIYECGQDENHTIGKEPFPGYYLIPIPAGYADCRITIELVSDYEAYAGNIYTLMYGVKGEVVLTLLKSQLAGAFGGLMLLVLALVLFLMKAAMGSYGRRQYEFTYLSIIMGLSGLFLLLDNQMLLLLLSGTQGIWVGRMMALILLPFFYIMYLYHIADKRQITRFINYALSVLLINYLAAVVLVLFGIVDAVVYSRIAIGIILVTTIFLTFIILAGAFYFKRSDLTYQGISNIVFFIFLIANVLMGLSDVLSLYADVMIAVGILVWCLLLLFQAMGRFADTMRGEQLLASRALTEYKQQTLTNLKPDTLFGGLHTLLEMMKRKDPQAMQYLVQISNYLRGRLNMLYYDKDTLIPFDEELQHILGALELMMQKNVDFSYETEIKVTDFKVPAFSIEAFVENAITHGAGDAEHPTLISLKTYETLRDYAIQIVDTGKGFDTDAVKSQSDYGINQVSKQLFRLLDASVDVRSRQGKGTVVTIKLPKRGKEEN